MSYNVKVSGIAKTTTHDHLHDFFTFCGTITKIDYTAGSETAIVHFERASAARTALMLNGGTLEGSTLSVTSDTAHDDHADEHDTEGGLRQEHKPRAGIAAELLASGYEISDNVMHRAIEIDNKHGISNRFINFIRGLDSSAGKTLLGPEKTISGKATEIASQATTQAKELDEKRGITKQLSDYYTKAINSPFGQKVLAFYTSTSKQVVDIHEEAKRIRETQKAANVGATPAAPAAPATAPPPGLSS